MAFSTSFGYTNSWNADSALKLEQIPLLTYEREYATKTSVPGDVVLVNTTTPIDQPEYLRFGIQEIANVYANTDIDPSFYAVSKKGSSLVVQVKDVLRVTDTADPNFIQDLPVEAHIVMRVPKSPYVTADMVQTVVNRAIAALFDGNTSSSRINQMLRGALDPIAN